VNCGLALSMLEEQARECGALLVVATHDMRAKARFEKCITL
jgi:ABC-type lipoprotein export system ATPase subunit